MAEPEPDDERGARASSELLAARRRSSSACAPRASTRSRTRSPGVAPIARGPRRARRPRAAARRPTRRYRVAGRLAARRGQGKVAFLDLVDRSGRIQLQARVDARRGAFERAARSLDLGDLIGVDGTAFVTRRGELTLRVDDCQLLAKSLRPPPDKHHGLADVETRYRQRELDLIANEEARELFITARAGSIAAIRRFLDDARLPRGRDAGAPAALRRRAGAPVRHAPQRARPRPLPAHRHRALPQAPDRRRPRARLRARQGLPQRGHLATSTTPSSRCSSGTRPTPTTRTTSRAARGARRRRRAQAVGYDGRDRLHAARGGA